MIQARETTITLQKDLVTGTVYTVHTMIRREQVSLDILNKRRAAIITKRDDFVLQCNNQITRIDKLITDLSHV